jgi:putative hydrolase of the HAD superfamily
LWHWPAVGLNVLQQKGFGAFLFDLDDTLLDRNAAIAPFVENLYHRYHPGGVSLEAFRCRFRELDGRGYADKHELFQTLVDEYALPTSVEDLVSGFRRTAWKGCKRFLYHDAAEVLKQLRSQGYKLGIVTNGSVESQRTKLIESDLVSLVDVTLISAEEGVKKPVPEIFTRAAQRLGVTVAECVFCGDDPQKDVGGAHYAGMKTVWVHRHKPWPRDLSFAPTYTVHTLEELLAKVSLRSGKTDEPSPSSLPRRSSQRTDESV